MLKCAIYNNRPDICRKWPSDEGEILEFPSCSFEIGKNKVVGSCNRCGECCFLNGDIFRQGRIFNNTKCEFLVED